MQDNTLNANQHTDPKPWSIANNFIFHLFTKHFIFPSPAQSKTACTGVDDQPRFKLDIEASINNTDRYFMKWYISFFSIGSLTGEGGLAELGYVNDQLSLFSKQNHINTRVIDKGKAYFFRSMFWVYQQFSYLHWLWKCLLPANLHRKIVYFCQKIGCYYHHHYRKGWYEFINKIHLFKIASVSAFQIEISMPVLQNP